MPDGNISSHEDISYDSGIGRHEDEAFVVDVEVVEVHDVARPVEGLGVFAGGL